MDRYFLKINGREEIEVTVVAYCRAERSAGFYPKCHPSYSQYFTTPATASFSNGSISGRVEYKK